MKDRLVDITTPSGRMETFISHPSEGGPFRPVIFYMDMWGVREEIYDLARRVSTAGYYAIVPDLYYRWGKVRTAIANAEGKQTSFTALDPAAQARQLDVMNRLSDAMAMDDTRALLAFMDAGEPVIPGPVGSIGFCLGGRHVLCATGTFPDRMRAGASLHGVNLVQDKPDSPHLLAAKGAGELYCGHAELDRFSSPEVLKVLNETFNDRKLNDGKLHGGKLKYFYELHRGIDHGYSLPDRDVFNKAAANRDWELIFAMFRRQLPMA